MPNLGKNFIYKVPDAIRKIITKPLLCWSKERWEKGDNKDGDASYWDGGRCNWGGSHNLQEDCENFYILGRA